MKRFLSYTGFIIQSRPLGFFASCFFYILNLLFAVGLYATASFIISLAALMPTYDLMMIPVVSVRMFGIGRAVLSYTERYFSHDNTFRVLKDLRLRLYDKMVPSLPDYERGRAEDLAKFVADVELLQEGILRLIYPLCSSLFLLIVGVILTSLLHPVLGITFAALFLINAYLFPALLFYAQTKRKESADHSKHQLYEDLLELKEGINEITSDGREADWLDRIDRQLDRMNGSSHQEQRFIALAEALIVFLQGISNFVILVVAAYLVVRGGLSGIYLAAVTLALTTMVTEIMLPGETYSKFKDLKSAADNVFAGEIDEGYFTALDQETAPPAGEQLVVRGLCWHYPQSRQLFRDFSLELRKGEVTAVVGESGCGKSTLVNLILGFLTPNAGEITVGTTRLNELSERERLSLFSVVDQKPFFFHQTILENMRLAKAGATAEEIMEVLRKVNLEQRIADAKEGLDTPIYEWGANLSGGELQRLAIARAVLKDAPFYIFDEPTAELDTINEKQVMALISTLAAAGHGVLLITHRMNLLEQVDSMIQL